MDIPTVWSLKGNQIKGRGGILKILGNLIGTNNSYAIDYKPQKFDHSNRYYLHDEVLLADTRGTLYKAKGLGGKPTHDYGKSRDVHGQQGISASGTAKVGPKILPKRDYSSGYKEAEFFDLDKYRKKFSALKATGKKHFGKTKGFLKKTLKTGKSLYGKAKKTYKEKMS